MSFSHWYPAILTNRIRASIHDITETYNTGKTVQKNLTCFIAKMVCNQRECDNANYVGSEQDWHYTEKSQPFSLNRFLLVCRDKRAKMLYKNNSLNHRTGESSLDHTKPLLVLEKAL